MKRINILSALMLFIVLGISLGSCEKDNNASTYPYAVRLTDAPGPYSAVNIDLQGVELTGNDGVNVVLNVKPGIYNLLNYANGVSTLIATDTLQGALVQQIRLILGSNNTVVVNGVTYPLSTPSADQSGLKLQVHQTLQAGVEYNCLLDFDANQSIILLGNGTYKLKPVIRTIEEAVGGSIKGKIVPAGTLAAITATSADNQSYSTTVTTAGDFMLMGLPVGTYTVTATPALPLLPVVSTNIAVTKGVTTTMATIAF